MFAGYVLVRIGAVDPGEVVKKLRAIEGVKQAHVVLGPTDCIAFVEVPDADGFSACLGAIRAVEGVEKTDTRLTV